MAAMKKVDCQVEIKSSADKFYDAFKNKLQHMPKIDDHVLSDVELVHGDSWESVGCVRNWTYNLGGKTLNMKETTEAVDDENKRITFKMVGGEGMNVFKSLKSSIAVTPKGAGSLVNWSMEYEKHDDSIPDPVDYKDFVATWFKNLDANLIKA